MIVTIEEARETMCIRLTGQRPSIDNPAIMCWGPRCMSWRTVEPTKGFCGEVPVWPEFKRTDKGGKE